MYTRGAAFEQALHHLAARLEPALEADPEVVLEGGDHGGTQPRHEDERRAAIPRHLAVPCLQFLDHFQPGIAERGPVERSEHQRFQIGKGRREHIRLHFARHGHVVRPVRSVDQRLDALLPVSLVPVEGHVQRVVRSDNLGVGGGDQSAFRIGLAWQRRIGRETAPVVDRVPARRRRPAHQLVRRITQRNPARRDKPDIAAGVGHHHRLHWRHERIETGLKVLDGAHFVEPRADESGRVVMRQRRPLQCRNGVVRQQLVEILVACGKHRSMPRPTPGEGDILAAPDPE